MGTKIEWADETINPVIGCQKISEGCAHCYAERMACRLALMPQTAERYAGITQDRQWTGITKCVPSELAKPGMWFTPKRIFVGSMTDLFHESVEEQWLDWIMCMICEEPRHTYMMLTKRPARMLEYFTENYKSMPENLWLGVTVENQDRADERIPLLLQTPAAVRFVSVEPMLGPIDFAGKRSLTGVFESPMLLPGIDWVICGAETGPGKRYMIPSWATRLRDHCAAWGIPFFFKKDSDGNHTLDGQVWEQVPEVKP